MIACKDIKCQSQFGVNAAMTFAILTTMELLENGVATYFGATPLWSIRTVLQASSQH